MHNRVQIVKKTFSFSLFSFIFKTFLPVYLTPELFFCYSLVFLIHFNLFSFGKFFYLCWIFSSLGLFNVCPPPLDLLFAFYNINHNIMQRLRLLTFSVWWGLADKHISVILFAIFVGKSSRRSQLPLIVGLPSAPLSNVFAEWIRLQSSFSHRFWMISHYICAVKWGFGDALERGSEEGTPPVG